MPHFPSIGSRECIPPNEAAAIEEILIAFRTQYLKRAQASKPALRGVHAKSHGCLEAKFIVEPNLPEVLSVGLFKTAKTYKAWLRFSNGWPTPRSDHWPDIRALAIKVEDVPGKKVLEDESDATTQDFILANHPGFFVRNAHDFAAFMRSQLTFFFGLDPFSWRLHELKNLTASFLTRIDSPLLSQYWSQAPYLFGTGAVKYMVRPRSKGRLYSWTDRSEDFLRQAMVNRLSMLGTSLDFCVQLQTSARQMPIEDPTVIWDPRLSPFHKLATIYIPPQEFDTTERDAFGENLSFHPWHCLPEHRPLGGISRVRKVLYTELSKVRHELNGVPRLEPGSL